MPNYRYHTPESNRRGYCGCSSSMNGCNQQQSNVRPQRESSKSLTAIAILPEKCPVQ